MKGQTLDAQFKVAGIDVSPEIRARLQEVRDLLPELEAARKALAALPGGGDRNAAIREGVRREGIRGDFQGVANEIIDQGNQARAKIAALEKQISTLEAQLAQLRARDQAQKDLEAQKAPPAPAVQDPRVRVNPFGVTTYERSPGVVEIVKVGDRTVQKLDELIEVVLRFI